MYQPPEQREHITREASHLLSPEQRTNLGCVMVSLTTRLLQRYPGELPEIIIPESSGRIMQMLFAPVLDAACDARGIERPTYHPFLISTPSTNDDLYGAMRFARGQQQTPEEILARAEAGILRPSLLPIEERELRHAVYIKEFAKQQAVDIVDQRQRTGKVRELIILDDGATEAAITYHAILNAFASAGETSVIPLYVLHQVRGSSPRSFDPNIIAGRYDGIEMADMGLKYFSMEIGQALKGVKKVSTAGVLSLETISRTPYQQMLYEMFQNDVADISQSVIAQLQEAGTI